MSEAKQVKVDGWGAFFLRRLKHFFNRTDYCDLTLQFQDNAQLKVHRLVINACTEYFEILERTCEMYEDCLIMPEDLQADVVVPIINFMYTGQLDYRADQLEKLYQTALIMNMTVLTKLLDEQKSLPRVHSNHYVDKSYGRKRPSNDQMKNIVPTSSKKQFISADPLLKKQFLSADPLHKKQLMMKSSDQYCSPSPIERITSAAVHLHSKTRKTNQILPPKPTRYELPEELDTDDVVDDSFTEISYKSKPLMMNLKNDMFASIYNEPSSSKRFDELKQIFKDSGTQPEFVECKKIDVTSSEMDSSESFTRSERKLYSNNANNRKKNPELFNQMLESGAKVTIEAKSKQIDTNIDHAKIISEVLKKYPHLVKSNKNIKLKIVNTGTKSPENKSATRKQQTIQRIKSEDAERVFEKDNDRGFTYESDVVDYKEAAKLISLGIENVKGPWICLICGTPGRALNFSSYYKFRRHLVEVHHEKQSSVICEYCGLKSTKRNHMVHHMLTKHGVPCPAAYSFPKCNICDYVGLSESLLAKHKQAHTEMRKVECYMCSETFPSSALLMHHIQTTGHRIGPNKKSNKQCIYCLKVFSKEGNLYTHLRAIHGPLARKDGIIASDDEEQEEKIMSYGKVKHEIIEDDDDEDSYEANENIKMFTKRKNHKILNQSFLMKNQPKTIRKVYTDENELQSVNENSSIGEEDNSSLNEEMVVLNESNISTETSLTNFVVHTHKSSKVTKYEVSQEKVFDTQNQAIHHKITNSPIEIVVSSAEDLKRLTEQNQSVIFEDTEQGKTLSVLTTASLDNNLQLQTSQSGDVMILQNDYPMHMQQSLSGDQSIVVLYSQEDAKQFMMNAQYGTSHIVSSEGITQFVHSSGSLPPSYESVTSTTPLIATQVVQPNANTWQSISQTIQGSGLPPNEVNSRSIQQVIVDSSRIEQNLRDLAEIQIVHQVPPEMTEVTSHGANIVEQTETLSENYIENNLPTTNIVDPNETLSGNYVQHVPIEDSELITPDIIENEKQAHKGETSQLMETDNNNLEVIETDLQSDMTEIEVVNNHAHIQANETNQPEEEIISVLETSHEEQIEISASDSIIEMHTTATTSALLDSERYSIENNLNPENQSDEQQNTFQLSEVSEQGLENVANKASESNSYEEPIETILEVTDSTNNAKHVDAHETVICENNEKNIAEWSDEEYEQAINNSNTEIQTVRSTTDMTGHTVVGVIETEETIENIQREVNELTQNQTESAEVSDITKKQEKISSLLNDWDDNDSQTDAVQETLETITKETEISELDNPSATLELVPTGIGSQEATEDDKENSEEIIHSIQDPIKKLVDDWDEDEEK